MSVKIEGRVCLQVRFRYARQAHFSKFYSYLFVRSLHYSLQFAKQHEKNEAIYCHFVLLFIPMYQLFMVYFAVNHPRSHPCHALRMEHNRLPPDISDLGGRRDDYCHAAVHRSGW